jgi:hypothetical protein
LDRKALALGRLYQEKTEWHRRRPAHGDGA